MRKLIHEGYSVVDMTMLWLVVQMVVLRYIHTALTTMRLLLWLVVQMVYLRYRQL